MQWCWLQFRNRGISFLELRFADDILPFAKLYEEIGEVFCLLVDAPRQAGLNPNAGKTKKKLTTRNDDFGTGPCAQVGSHDLSLQHRLVAASKAVFTTNRLCLSTVWPLHID